MKAEKFYRVSMECRTKEERELILDALADLDLPYSMNITYPVLKEVIYLK